jgi:hypothetical protein
MVSTNDGSSNCSSNTFLGQLKPEAMITSHVSLDEVVDKGFKALLEQYYVFTTVHPPGFCSVDRDAPARP